MRDFTYLKNVVTLALEEEKCVGCGMCTTVCPHGVFRMVGGRAKIVRRDGCIECGGCAMNCPVEAISVQAGVGCAAAVINSFLGRESSSCCCVVEPKGQRDRSLRVAAQDETPDPPRIPRFFKKTHT